MKIVNLCSRPGSCCPSVTVHDDGSVSIGEKYKTARLTPEHWKMLKQKIKNGDL